jgi:hypothetical protein
MPLTKKGRKIKAAMIAEYGSKRKGEQVFYASENKGTIKGVAKGKKHHKKG